MGRRPLAVAVALGPIALLVILAFVDPDVTRRLVDDEGPVEWLQVAFLLLAAALGAMWVGRRARAGQPIAFEVVIVTLLLALALGELELDRWLFGTKLIGPRFLFRPRHPVAWPWRVLVVLIGFGVPLAIAVYALTRLREVVRSGLAALGEPWGRLLFVGCALFGMTNVFEKAVNRVHFVSHTFVEEALELLATCCIAAAYLIRSDAPRR